MTSSRFAPSRPSLHAQGGFTLIELIVVIVILGVLAAVAMPRFTSLQGDARGAKAAALAGSIRAAASVTKSTAIARGVSCASATGTSVTLEGATVNLAYCYPASTATGAIVAANISATNDDVTVAHATSPNKTTVTINGATTPASCKVEYSEPTATDGQPTVVTTVSGC